MPFTDQELATAMSAAIVEAGVMTEKQLGVLTSEGHTEEDVRVALTADQISAFPRYWLLINRWLVTRGGTVKAIAARNVQGRAPGVDPGSIPKRILYDDAFAQTQIHIATPGFSDVKAIANTLRFISTMLDL